MRRRLWARPAPTIPAGRRSAVGLPATPPRRRLPPAALHGRPDDPASWDRLDALIAVQFWRPAKFSLANEAINYRRFFAVSDLAGVRVEDPEVFDATHALILALVDEGLVDGLRVDHIDGLRDPRAYLRRLRERAPRLGYLLVEKILAPGRGAARGLGRRRHDRLRVRKSAHRSPDRSGRRAASRPQLCGVYRAGRLPRGRRPRGQARGDGG